MSGRRRHEVIEIAIETVGRQLERPRPGAARGLPAGRAAQAAPARRPAVDLAADRLGRTAASGVRDLAGHVSAARSNRARRSSDQRQRRQRERRRAPSGGGPPTSPQGLASLVAGAISAIARRRSRACPRPTSTSATPTTSASNCPACGCSPASTSAPTCAGLKNIPAEGPVLLVGNHSGGNMTPDTTVFSLAFNTYFGVERRFYQLAHNLVLQHAGPGPAAEVRHRGGQPRERQPGARDAARRCSSTRAATTRSTARAGTPARSTSAAARASSAWR